MSSVSLKCRRPTALCLIRGADYTLNNPDTLTKYKTAAQISHKVLEAVTGKSVLFGDLDILKI